MSVSPRERPAAWPRFSSPLRSTALTARLGRVIGIFFGTWLGTGFLSSGPWPTVVQGGLVVGGLIMVVAIPSILRAGQEPASKAIRQQNFGGNLTILLGVVAAASLVQQTTNTFEQVHRTPSPVDFPLDADGR